MYRLTVNVGVSGEIGLQVKSRDVMIISYCVLQHVPLNSLHIMERFTAEKSSKTFQEKQHCLCSLAAIFDITVKNFWAFRQTNVSQSHGQQT